MEEENKTQQIKSILLWLNRSTKKCCGSDLESLIRFCDDPISPWIKITPETDFEADTEYLWCKKGHKPMSGDIELYFEGGYGFTHYMFPSEL